ncbi:MAG TPA: deoxyribodipyrimidine photo-lyase, partial [Methylophilaceae bacterium]|nr:deoxyribodipyrimidine photo-lyase [Methylophilaceae bacterium]
MATSETQYDTALVWFRRDLRDYDHAALYHALKSSRRVFCAFIFDTDILDSLPSRSDRRVEFIHDSICQLDEALKKHGGGLIVRHGSARKLIPTLAIELNAEAVLCNRDYEPSANERDQAVAQALERDEIEFHAFKDQVLFEQDEILTQGGKPFSVFTPYKNAVLKKLDDFYLKSYPVDRYAGRLAHKPGERLPSLSDLGFETTNLHEMKLPTGMTGGRILFDDFQERIGRYKQARDFPAVKGPSYLSIHLRFGTVSIRHLARTARDIGGQGAETWLSELIWRDFYAQVLHHHPQVANGHAFRPELDKLQFPGGQALFKAWCEGRTGYPLIDAAMRQINQTGYMHNRLRMVTASFLSKDLLVDWRWGERYFAEHLIDYDLASNNGGWQWAASTGCDAQPWF